MEFFFFALKMKLTSMNNIAKIHYCSISFDAFFLTLGFIGAEQFQVNLNIWVRVVFGDDSLIKHP